MPAGGELSSMYITALCLLVSQTAPKERTARTADRTADTATTRHRVVPTTGTVKRVVIATMRVCCVKVSVLCVNT